MQSTGKDRSKIIEINGQRPIYSVFFTADGEQVLSGGDEGMLRRWRVDDGHEVGEAIRAGSGIYAVALSPDRKWLVCVLSAQPHVRVWDAETHAKIVDIHGHTSTTQSVDISSDSTTFATGGQDRRAFIWSITTGKCLVGPLQHDSNVVAVRFSQNGDRLATAAVNKSIRIFNSDNGQQVFDIPCSFGQWISSPLAWSADGRQLFAVSASFGGAKCFDASSGSLLSTWSVPDNSLLYPSIAPSRNQKFVAIAGNNSLSFWDASTREQIGPVIPHKSGVYFIALTPNDDYIVTSEQNGKVTLRSLRDILPDPYFTVHVSGSTPLVKVGESKRSQCTPFGSSDQSQLPLIQTTDTTFEAWTQGDLTRVEQVLTEEILHPPNTSCHAHALAYRALVRSRSKQYNLAIDDAKKSINIQRSTIGHIAIAIARAGNGEPDAAIRVFDLVFIDGLSTENNLLLLIKAVVLFECGKHGEAILRVEDLIDIMDDKSMYIAVRAQMYLLLGGMLLGKGDHERAVELLVHFREAVPPLNSPQLVVISLLFGWDFDGLALAIQLHIQQCIKALEDIGDAAMQSENTEEAIARYSTALSLNPSDPAGLLVKRSKARAVMTLWEDALKDADEAIKADPQGPWGYERRHAALHALAHYDEAVDTLSHMISLTEESLDPDTHCKCHCGGGGNAALGHLLEDIVARSGEATVLAWTGKSSSYNSCLPATLAIHNQIPHASPAIEDAEMDVHVAALRSSVSPTDAILIHERVTRLPPARFAHRQLYLPCIMFPVKKLVAKGIGSGGEQCYRARVSGIGHVEFQTSDSLSLTEPRKLVFVHPWIRDLRGPHDEFGWGSKSDSDESGSDSEAEAHSPPAAFLLQAVPAAMVDDYTRALQLIVRLQQPFRALLLQQQPRGRYKRVATEHEIVVPGIEYRINSAKDIRTKVVEIL